MTLHQHGLLRDVVTMDRDLSEWSIESERDVIANVNLQVESVLAASTICPTGAPGTVPVQRSNRSPQREVGRGYLPVC